MNTELFANLFLQEHATVNGRNVWHYLIDSALGQYHVVQYENPRSEIHEQIVPHNNDKAEALFRRFVKEMLDGKI